MRINADTYRQELLIEGGMPADPSGKRGLKIFYSSIHDIVSVLEPLLILGFA